MSQQEVNGEQWTVNGKKLEIFGQRSQILQHFYFRGIGIICFKFWYLSFEFILFSYCDPFGGGGF
jgi:hypothetical protein